MKSKAGISIKRLIILAVIAMCAVLGLSAYVALSEYSNIAMVYDGAAISPESTESADSIEACKSIEPECILVLGCAVWDDNQPSPMLKERLDAAIALYEAGVAPKLLMTGDNSRAEYSEPDCMLAYALEKDVPKEDIFLDFAGFSTYDSIYRAAEIFGVKKCVVVTQKYHLFRALKLCDALGIDAKGVASNQRKYRGRYMRELREVLARDKDFVKGIAKPKPTYLGEKIPITGDGTATHLN